MLTNLLTSVLIILAVILLFFWLLNNPKTGKILIGTILVVGIAGLTIYCGINLNSYYSAEGGIFGVLTGREEVNVVEVKEFEYKFKNLELLQTDTGAYTATIVLDETFKLDDDTTYGVYINKVPCDLVEYGRDYLLSKFTYVFYNEAMEVTCKDTLSFAFSFFENFTKIIVSSNGNDTAIKNWNKFLNANNMVLTIKSVDYSSNGDIEFGTGDIANFTEVVYLVDGVEYYSTYQKIGEKYKLPDAPEKTNNEFIGWKLNGQLIDSSSKVQGADVLIASFNYREQTNFKILSGDKSYDYIVFSDETFTFPSELDGVKIEGYVLEENYKNLSGALGYDYRPGDKNTIVNGEVLRAVAWRGIELLTAELTAGDSFINGVLRYNRESIFNACKYASFHPKLKYKVTIDAVISNKDITQTFDMTDFYGIDKNYVFVGTNDGIKLGDSKDNLCRMTFDNINNVFSVQSLGENGGKFTKITLNDMYALY